MTAIESLVQQLEEAREQVQILDLAKGNHVISAKVQLANLVLGAFPTIQHALEELDRRRIA